MPYQRSVSTFAGKGGGGWEDGGGGFPIAFLLLRHFLISICSIRIVCSLEGKIADEVATLDEISAVCMDI